MQWRFWKRPAPVAVVREAPVPRSADGFYYRDGHRLCEDCWSPIPRYVDFPDGLTSPESDGTPALNYSDAKRRAMAVEGKDGTEALRKAVCLACYKAAFGRMYPKARMTPLSDLVLPPATKYTPAPEPPMIHIPEPRS